MVEELRRSLADCGDFQFGHSAGDVGRFAIPVPGQVLTVCDLVLESRIWGWILRVCGTQGVRVILPQFSLIGRGFLVVDLGLSAAPFGELAVVFCRVRHFSKPLPVPVCLYFTMLWLLILGQAKTR